MIIKSSHDHELDRAGATMALTRLSLSPYADKLANACRSVHDAPSQQSCKDCAAPMHDMPFGTVR